MVAAAFAAGADAACQQADSYVCAQTLPQTDAYTQTTQNTRQWLTSSAPLGVSAQKIRLQHPKARLLLSQGGIPLLASSFAVRTDHGIQVRIA